MLSSGGIVVVPTETVYGAAGLLTHPEGRRRLQALRGGDEPRPFIVHLARPGDAGLFGRPLCAGDATGSLTRRTNIPPSNGGCAHDRSAAPGCSHDGGTHPAPSG